MSRWFTNRVVFRLLSIALSAIALPLPAPAVTTQSATSVPPLKQTVYAYDGIPVQRVSDNVLTDSAASDQLDPSLGQGAGFLAAKTPFQIANEGGRHAGFLRNYAGKSPAEMRKGMASLEKQIAEHRAKIADPESALPGFKQLDPRQQKALLESKWPSDIQRQQEQMSILKSLLGED